MKKYWLQKFFIQRAALVLICLLSFSQIAAAQTSTEIIGFRRGLATVMLAGLGGAVLGMSTLSFYGEPQEHIGNIWTGLALGALGGAAYIFSQVQPSNQMNVFETPEQKSLAPAQNLVRHQAQPLFFYDWTF